MRAKALVIRLITIAAQAWVVLVSDALEVVGALIKDDRDGVGMTPAPNISHLAGLLLVPLHSGARGPRRGYPGLLFRPRSP